MKKRDNMMNKQQMLLIEKALKIIQNPHYKHEPQNYETLAAVLSKSNFFQQKLEHPANLHDFMDLAKRHLTYEVLPYGAVITKEDEFATKFCIVLKGEVQKLKQKTHETYLEGSRNNLSIQPTEILSYRGSTKKKNLTIVHPNPSPDKNTLSPNFKPRANTRAPAHSKTIIQVEPQSFRLRRGHTRGRFEAMEDQISSDAQIPGSIGSIQTLSLSPIKADSESPKKFLFNFSPKSILLKRTETQEPNTEQQTNDDTEAESRDSKMNGQMKKSELMRKEGTASKEPTKEWLGFIEYIGSENLDLEDRLFSDGEVKVQKVHVYTRGDHFGENFYKPHQRKENCIIAVSSEETHLLTLSRDSYKAIMTELNQDFQQKTQVFTDSLQSFGRDLVDRVAYYFSRRKFKKGETIYCQNDAVQNLYLLKGGDVRLVKEIEGLTQRDVTQTSWNPLLTSPRRQDKIDLPIISVAPNQFFGEELVLGREFREYSAIAHSNETIVYFLEKSTYNEIKAEFEVFFQGLVEQTQKRFKWRQQRANDLLKQQHNLALAKMVLDPIANETPRLHNIGASQSVSPIKDGATLKLRALPMNFEVERQRNANIYLKAEGGKTERTIDVSSVEKNLELYKTKYSRKILEHKPEGAYKIKKRMEEGSRNDDSGSCIKEFNVRKELDMSYTIKPKKHNLSSFVGLNRTESQKKASESTRTHGVSFARLIGQQLTERNISQDEVKNVGMLTARDLSQDIPSSNGVDNKLRLKKLLKPRDFLSNLYGFLQKNGDEIYGLPQLGNLTSTNDVRNIGTASNIGLSPQLYVRMQMKKKEKTGPSLAS